MGVGSTESRNRRTVLRSQGNPGVVAHLDHLNTQEAETGGWSGVQGKPEPHSEFQVSLGVMRPCQNTNKHTRQEEDCGCVGWHEGRVLGACILV